MYDKINGKKSNIRIIDPLSFIPKEQLDKIWDMCNSDITITIIDFPLVFGTQEFTVTFDEPYYQPEFFDPCYNCGNNPKNNPHASGNCCCSLPSKNITYEI